MNNTESTSIFRRVTSVGVLCIALLGSVAFFTGCRPARWDSATIQEVSAEGLTVNEWPEARIIASGAGQWLRFETKEGKLITIKTQYRIIYR